MKPSTRIGDFLILGEIGRGGMGVVYEAEQVSLGRRVALKVLSEVASLDPIQRQRFQVEAQAAALLHHEHIVPVFGFGTDRGIPYYAMQFIDGWSLAEIIRAHRAELQANRPDGGVGPGVTAEFQDRGERPTPHPAGTLSPPASAGPRRGVDRAESSAPSVFAGGKRFLRAAVELGLQAAEALDHAHSVGVIHRDIKPSNLLVEPRGHLWVADFGLALIQQEDAGLTRTGDLLGTLRYMCPEQVRGGRAGATPQADLYSLGVTLYELLTLRPPFASSDRQELTHRILHDEPTPLRRINPAIPKDLETIVLKAMSKEPLARYGSARELADDLRRFLADRPILARRPGPVERALKWSRRRRAVVVTAAAVLLVTLSVSTALLWRANRITAAALDRQRQARIEQVLAFELSLGTI